MIGAADEVRAAAEEIPPIAAGEDLAVTDEKQAATEKIPPIAVEEELITMEEPRGQDGVHTRTPNGMRTMGAEDQMRDELESLELAIRENIVTTHTQEGADVQKALLLSKMDSVERQRLVVLRLTKRSSYVIAALLNDSRLRKVEAQVGEAGCEILPDWAEGALLLAPLTEEQATEANVKLRAHHIVVTKQDQGYVTQALAKLPKRHRSSAHPADPEYINMSKEAAAATGSSQSDMVKPKQQLHTPGIEIWDGVWHVERTFVHCPLAPAMS